MLTEIQTITNSITPQDIVVAGSSTLDTMERASIDMQITTAHQFPRSITLFNQRAIAIVTQDVETAESCIYRREVGKDRNGQPTFAEGLSVRMAEIVASCYGNLRVGARIVDQNPRYVVAQGVAHDLETNVLSTSEVIESTVTRNGQPFSERMRITVAKAALAKARRDAIFQVVPKALAKPIENEIKKMLWGSGVPLSERRARVNLWVTTLGIDPQRVWKAIGVVGPDDMNANHLELLTGLKTAIRSGEQSIDDAFPEIKEDVPSVEERLKTRASKAKKQQTDVLQFETPQPETQISPEKRTEIERWIQDGCETKEDYEIAVKSLCDQGMIKPIQISEAWDIVRQVAAKNGISMEA